MDATANLSPTSPHAGPLQPLKRSRLYWAIADALVIAKRNLQHIPRVPEKLLDVTIQPVIFVLLFRFVFGGAINTGVSYVNFLMPGIFVQSLLFGSMGTGVGLAEDLQRGLIDRFRSLAMAPSAVLAGRTIADLAQSTLGVAVMLTVGLLVGYRPTAGVLGWIAATALMLFFAFACLWIGATIGLVARGVEGVQAVGFIAIFPLTFASSAFVPTSTMPPWLRVFTAHQPVTLTVNAVRGLLLNQPVGTTAVAALAWCVGILVVFAPLSVALYQRKTAR